MQDIIAIVAPRPLRLGLHHHQHHHTSHSSPLADALASIHLHDDHPLDRPAPPPSVSSSSSSSCASSILCDESTSNSSIQSTPISTSTRLSLPQEALEEFLSISLKRINNRRYTASSSSLPYQRPHPYKMRKSASSGSSSAADDDHHRRSRRGVGTRSHRILEDDLRSTSPLVQDDSPEWRNFSLGSPISRNQTRNPLPRHPALEALTSNLRFSLDPYISPPPLLLASPVSPVQAHSPEESLQP